MRWSLLLFLAIGIVLATEKVDETESTTVATSKESETTVQAAVDRSDDSETSETLIVESRVIPHAAYPNVINNQVLREGPMGPYLFKSPIIPPLAGIPNSYRGPHHGPQFKPHQPVYPGLRYPGNLNPGKKTVPETLAEKPTEIPEKEKSKKKPVYKPKPQYLPKESSYSSVPDQPIPNSARFVPDPSRNQVIETVSASEMHKLTAMPGQPFPMMSHSHGLPMPHFPGPHGPGPHGPPFMHVIPYGGQQQEETSTVRYDETDHTFIDRMWGEVMSVRRTMSDNIFVGIPNMLRQFWEAIRGTVSATARMFTVDASDVLSDISSRVGEVTSRMVNNIDYMDVFRLIYSQFS